MTERKQISLQKDNTHSALDALERLLSYTNGLGDGAAYTIRAALAAQLTKTDDNVSCPSVANAGDINAELLEALKEIKYKSESHLNNGLGDFAGYISDIRMIVTEAIASAEQKGGV